jgi:hypothetical protein
MNTQLELLVKLINTLPGIVVVRFTDGVNKSKDFESIELSADENIVQFFAEATTAGSISLGVLTRAAEDIGLNTKLDNGYALITTWTGDDVTELYYELQLGGGITPEDYMDNINKYIEYVINTYTNEQVESATTKENTDDIVWN